MKLDVQASENQVVLENLDNSVYDISSVNNFACGNISALVGKCESTF